MKGVGGRGARLEKSTTERRMEKRSGRKRNNGGKKGGVRGNGSGGGGGGKQRNGRVGRRRKRASVFRETDTRTRRSKGEKDGRRIVAVGGNGTENARG